MQADRLTSAMLVGVLVRRAASVGGFATVLVKGDDISGVILVQAAEKGENHGLFERVFDLSGTCALRRCGPAPEEGTDALSQYIERRRRSDPDLWVIELDIADAERFAAETIC
jgi:hypothetical protein